MLPNCWTDFVPLLKTDDLETSTELYCHVASLEKPGRLIWIGKPMVMDMQPYFEMQTSKTDCMMEASEVFSVVESGNAMGKC